MSAFHVYVESPVDRSPAGIERLAVAISQKYGLSVPDLIKRMTAGRFRVKANVDAATADAYARALEQVGARVKVEEAHPTLPILVVPPEPAPPTARPIEPPRAPAPTMPGEKPSRGGRYSVSPPPSSSRTALPGPPRSNTPSAGPPLAPPPSRPTAPSVPPARALDDDLFGDLELAPPSATSTNPSSSQLPIVTERTGATLQPPANPARPAMSSLPPATSSRPPVSSLPPASAPRPATSSLSPADASPPATAARASSTAYQSGLSAAYSQQLPVTSDLGALGEDVLSLSPLDGDDGNGNGNGSVAFDAPSPGMPASIGPAPESPSPVTFAPPKPSASAVPFDMFAPPDAEEAEQIVNLAPAEAAVARPQLKPGQSPPLGVPSTPAMRKAAVSQGAALGGVSVPEMPRSRLAAGVLLAVLLGFLPAHLIASMRENSAFQKIDDQIIATQAAVDTPELYATLDAFRDAQLARKESERRSIALASMLIWAVVAAGVGYVWFRRIPWDRMQRA